MAKKRGAIPITEVLIIAIIILFLGAAGVIVNNYIKYGDVAPTMVNCGTDQECFLEHANECTPAKGLTEISGAIVTNEILENCILKKTIVELPEEEPIEFKILFEDKRMLCPYLKNSFDPNLAYTLSIGMEGCSGSLKNAMTSFIDAYEEYNA